MRYFALIALLMFGSGCASRSRTVVVERPHRTVVRTREVGPPPPAPRTFVVKPARPGKGHVWVSGHWVRRGGRYTWVAGRWRVPPRHGAVWVRGSWKGGVWVAPRWR